MVEDKQEFPDEKKEQIEEINEKELKDNKVDKIDDEKVENEVIQDRDVVKVDKSKIINEKNDIVIEDKKEETQEDKDEEVKEKVEIVERKKLKTVKIKPEIDEETKKILKIRAEIKKRKPKFRRQEWFRYKKLGNKWRKPKGLHSKMRRNIKYRPNMVRIGYGSPRKTRGLHPSGFEDILIHNINELEKIKPKKQAARIAHSVGFKKRELIIERADEMGIRILNRGV